MALWRVFPRLRPLAMGTNKRLLAPELPSLKLTSRSDTSLSARRSSRFPLQLSSIESKMPLHSAVASARLVSSLTIESQSWGLVPQGISMPL